MEEENKLCSCCKKNPHKIIFTFGLLGAGHMMSLEFCVPCLLLFNALIKEGVFETFVKTLPEEETNIIATQLVEAQRKGFSIPKNVRDN